MRFFLTVFNRLWRARKRPTVQQSQDAAERIMMGGTLSSEELDQIAGGSVYPRQILGNWIIPESVLADYADLQQRSEEAITALGDEAEQAETSRVSLQGTGPAQARCAHWRDGNRLHRHMHLWPASRRPVARLGRAARPSTCGSGSSR